MGSGSPRGGSRRRPGGIATCPRRITVRAGAQSAAHLVSRAGLSDLRSYQKRIPTALHSATNREISVFLRHLWATDGNVTVPRSRTAPKVYYASSSRELADGVALLLARFGIVARIRQVTKSGYRPVFHVIVADGPSLRVFCGEIGVHGARGELAGELLAFPDGRAVNTNVGHPADRGLGPRQGRTNSCRPVRTPVPGGDRHALLRVNPLQELPVTGAADALRERAGFGCAQADREQ